MDINIYEIFAILSSLICLSAFAYINRKPDARSDVLYALMNIVGASFMLISLVEFWNIGVLISNTAWVFIGVYGLIKNNLLTNNTQSKL